ncbi:E3 ubiquitin-protein ligase XIAP [Biomphalaria glabrata]|nr:E3 ubiquitin-protein ligase XIAP [Biomphalaria glabrata]
MTNILQDQIQLKVNILQTILSESLARSASSFCISGAQRLATFKMYPSADKVSPTLLASDGFIYTGSDMDDSVMCIYCLKTKRNWKQGDSVADVHRQIAPDCPMVTKVFKNHKQVKSAAMVTFNTQESNQAGKHKTHQPELSDDSALETDAALGVLQSSSVRPLPQDRSLMHFVTFGTAKPFIEIATGNNATSIITAEEVRSNGIVSQVSENDSEFSESINSNQLDVMGENEAVLSSFIESEREVPRLDPAESLSGATTLTGSMSSLNSIDSRSNLSQDNGAVEEQSNMVTGNDQRQNEAQPSSNLTADDVSASSNVEGNIRESLISGANGGQSLTNARSNQNNNKAPTYSELGIITERPKRAEYALKLKRRETFGTWPRDHHLNPIELSDAGFYYAGYGDCTRCFYCGGGLRNWEDEDDVWVEHARWFPKCAFIRQQMGQVFVETVQELTKSQEKIPFEDVMNKMGVSVETFRLDSKTAPLKRDPAVQALVQLGFPEKQVIDVATRLKEEANLISADSIVEKLTEEGIRRSESFPIAIKDQTVDFETLRQLKEDNNQMRQQIVCKICMDKEVAVTFLPCGHLVSCADCALAMKDCPVCRKNVRGVVRAFLSVSLD